MSPWWCGRRGLALPLALLLCLALGFVGSAAGALTVTATRIAANSDAYQRAFDVAEGGLDRGVEQLAAAYEAGVVIPDTLTLVSADSLNGCVYDVRVEARREPGGLDLNRNGVPGEIVLYDRAWGYAEAAAAGAPAEPGEPVRLITSRARARLAAETLILEVAFERDPAVADARARGAWRALPLRWSSLDDPR